MHNVYNIFYIIFYINKQIFIIFIEYHLSATLTITKILKADIIILNFYIFVVYDKNVILYTLLLYLNVFKKKLEIRFFLSHSKNYRNKILTLKHLQ